MYADFDGVTAVEGRVCIDLGKMYNASTAQNNQTE